MDKVYTPVFGKDVLESLTLGMYEDSRIIFREYIQNSADQIDKAIICGLLAKEEAAIHITIDTTKKEITIEDNATGIPENEVRPILLNIAQSTKIRGIDKGFRGIGRLGGLAYCQKLIFETSYKGESSKSILTWDAELLKNIINNRNEKEEAIKVVQEVTSFQVEKEKAESHYFKVILLGVSNTDLLNKREIENYLSIVAPLPFSTKFIYRSEIYKEIAKEGFSLDEYKIFLNEDQLFKCYSTYIYEGEESNKRKIDEIIDVCFFKEIDNLGNLLFWGWYGISTLNRQLKSINRARGIRLRKSNIQMGGEETLNKLHKENRGNLYFFGEVHAIHRDLIPNSRRDYFIENNIYNDFEIKVKNFFYNHLYKLYYTASEINSANKKIEELKNLQEEFSLKQNGGFSNTKEHENFINKLEKKKEEAKKAKKKIEKIEQDFNDESGKPIIKILNKVVPPDNKLPYVLVDVPNSNLKPKFRTDNLSNLSKEQRKFLSKIFTIIGDVLDPNMAENLIRKIEEELK